MPLLSLYHCWCPLFPLTPLAHLLIPHPSATLCCHFFITTLLLTSIRNVKNFFSPQTPYFWTSTRWPASELDYGNNQTHVYSGLKTTRIISTKKPSLLASEGEFPLIIKCDKL